MKTLLKFLCITVFLSLLCSCSQTTATSASSAQVDVALVTDVGTIDDKSFNQGAWEGIKSYCDENNVTYAYYQPEEKTDTAFLASIKEAVDRGAKLVVCPGFLFEPTVYTAQNAYPDVSFILLDGVPHSDDYKEYGTGKNVYSIQFAEDQAGFLAGYAVVKDGYTSLGFMGGMAIPSVLRFGYGFVMGAEYAAKEMGKDGVTIRYHYTGDFSDTPENRTMAASWYQSGTEIIFGCGGAVGNSVMASAEEYGAKMIGVDVDQSAESETVVTSAMKMLRKSVYDGIKAYYDGTFRGGKDVTLDASVNGVGLPMSESRFTTFTEADYDAIYAKLKSGEIPRIMDTDYASAAELPLEAVKVRIFE